ncbi:hypothetical protein X777_16224, partial [Ooceraea biroi]
EFVNPDETINAERYSRQLSDLAAEMEQRETIGKSRQYGSSNFGYQYERRKCGVTATCKSAADIWKQLLSVYEQSSGQRLDRLLESFFSAEKKATEDIAGYVSRLKQLFTEINDELDSLTQVKLPELLLLSRIMSTLPSEYFEFKNVWESVPIQDRTVNLFLERLRLIEMRLPESTKTESGAALSIKTKGKDIKKKFRKSIRCFI